jgi:hypothetical protein
MALSVNATYFIDGYTKRNLQRTVIMVDTKQSISCTLCGKRDILNENRLI